MVRVDGGGGVDLQTVVALAGVLKQTVHGVEHLVGQQEEPLPEGGWGREREKKKGRVNERGHQNKIRLHN